MVPTPFRALAIGLVMVLSEAYPISSNGCQCTAGCSVQLSTIVYTCPVASSCGGTDDCNVEWLSSATAWLSGAGSSISAKATKIASWTSDNIKQLPVGNIQAYAGQLSSDVWDKLSSPQVQAISTAEVLKRANNMAANTGDAANRLSSKVLSSLSAAQVKDWPANVIASSKGLVGHLDLTAIGGWTKAQMAAIPPVDISQWPGVQLAKIAPGQLAKFTKEQLNAINPNAIASFTQTQWDSIPVDKLLQLSVEGAQKIPFERIGSITESAWQAVPVDGIVKLTGAQIQRINPAAAAGVAQKLFSATIDPLHAVVFFTANMVNQSGLIGSFDPYYIAHMSSSTWESIPVYTITQFSLRQLQAIDYRALGHWTDAMWQAVPVSDLVQFVGLQVQTIPASIIANWTQAQWDQVPVDQLVLFTSDQINNGDVLGKIGAARIKYLNPAATTAFTGVLPNGFAPSVLASEAPQIVTLLQDLQTAQRTANDKQVQLAGLEISANSSSTADATAIDSLKAEIDTADATADTKRAALRALGYEAAAEPQAPELATTDGASGANSQYATVPVVTLAMVVALLQLQ